MGENGYNGWSNYATWCVNLWLSNDQGTDETVNEMTRDAYKDAEGTQYRTREQVAVSDLADALQNFVDEMNPHADEASLFSDLLGSALSSVNWYELAEHYVDDLDKDEFVEMKECDECGDEMSESDYDAGGGLCDACQEARDEGDEETSDGGDDLDEDE